MNNKTFFGLSPTQLNVAFLALVAALALGAVFAAGGPRKAMDEARGALGLDSPPTFTQSAEDATPAPQETAPPPCTQLAVGCDALVANTGAWLNLRDAPSVNGQVVGRIDDGTVVPLVGGPTQSDGYIWWQVRLSGGDGWVAESDGITKWLTVVDSKPTVVQVPPPSPCPTWWLKDEAGRSVPYHAIIEGSGPVVGDCNEVPLCPPGYGCTIACPDSMTADEMERDMFSYGAYNENSCALRDCPMERSIYRVTPYKPFVHERGKITTSAVPENNVMECWPVAQQGYSPWPTYESSVIRESDCGGAPKEDADGICYDQYGYRHVRSGFNSWSPICEVAGFSDEPVCHVGASIADPTCQVCLSAGPCRVFGNDPPPEYPPCNPDGSIPEGAAGCRP